MNSQTTELTGPDRVPWWKETVIYHIYPRSFQDTNNDGLGDLAGITQRLPYIRDLGVGAIWMGPVFPSPQVDNGYDISDYRDIDPLFGTIDDMDRLIARAHALGIRVLLDLVFNHTSDQHPWFVQSRDDPAGPYGEWYIWRDEPNNWRSFFSVPAWTWSPKRNQYFLHLFAPEQPDLNWENPAVRAELADIANFWLDRGVDGFRLDVINLVSKRSGLPSLPPDAPPNGYYIDGPRAAAWLREFRSRLRSDREIVLVGETPGITEEAARTYTTTSALDMVLLFDHLAVDHGPGGRWDPRPLRIEALRDVVRRWQGALEEPSWPSIYLSNHDQPRVVSRYGDDRDYRYESATALATAFYLQRGTPIVYQGDEIAMRNYPLGSPEEIRDIETANAYRMLVNEDGVDPDEAFSRVRREARDNSRTPMQWSREAHAGFTTATPWFPVNPDYREWNTEVPVAGNERGAAAVLSFFRRVLQIRRDWNVLLNGRFEILGDAHGIAAESPLFAFRRAPRDNTSGPGILVIVNLGADEAPSVPLESGPVRSMVLYNYPDRRDSAPPDVLRPWEALVIQEERV